MAIYRCDLFKDAGYGKGDNIYSKSGMETLRNAEGEEIGKEWKNYCVIDDSSKFAAAVYYHYINKEILKDEKQEKRTAYDIDLWGTSSVDYLSLNRFTKRILKSGKFEIYKWEHIQENQNKSKDFNLQVGDLICRSGNVEFYIGNNKVVSWGRLHKTYTLNKEFHLETNGIHSNFYEELGMPYTVFIRFRGGK